MCGICGIWSDSGVSEKTLRRMAGAIRHRGPDDEGFYQRGPVGLASRRLSIIDVAGGRQPIANEDESIWIVFNGEIYNYPELRARLLARGHRFTTRTDTEVVVHLYEEYGERCVEHLRGMFAFAIWDERAQQLLLARDPLGQKPLYYTRHGGDFLFASEIKALLEDERIAPRPNVRAMHNYMSLRYIPGADTLFAGIEKLPAGHTLTLGSGQIALRSYWDLRYTTKLAGAEAEIVADLRELLLDTVRCHMLSDVPLGAFLSGGLDSSLIVAMMAWHADRPITTFSVGVREQDFNELPFARMVAERYGTEHHELLVEPDLVATVPEMIWFMEEPVDPFAFGVFSVARLASEHVKVVLGGDGGDEMFAGYDRYLGNQLVDLYCLLPPALRRRVLEPLIRRLPDDLSYNSRVQKLRWMVAMSETSAGERYARSASFLRFSHSHKQALYTDQLWAELGGLDSSAYLLELFDADNARHPIDKMLFTDVKTRLADHLLMISDRMTSAHSLEGRSPLVDQKVAEYAAAVPASLKLRGRTLKYIQRRIARDFLPDALLHRRKQGFSFPLAHWFRGDLRDVARSLLLGSNLVSHGYFRRSAIAALLDEHAAGRVDHNYRLWLLLTLELWHRLYVNKESWEGLRDELAGSLPAAMQRASSGYAKQPAPAAIERLPL